MCFGERSSFEIRLGDHRNGLTHEGCKRLDAAWFVLAAGIAS
jgi:hypothetical protein